MWRPRRCAPGSRAELPPPWQATFVCTIYIEDGLERLFRMFPSGDDAEYGDFFEALVQLLLFVVVVTLALALNGTTSSRIFTPRVRELLTDYALFIAVAVAIAVSYVPSIDHRLKQADAPLVRIDLPQTYGPTCQCYNGTASGSAATAGCISFEPADSSSCAAAESPRPWFVGHRLLEVPGSAVVYAALISIPITALFFIDQNLSNLLTQTPCRGLRKGSYYHSGFLLVGLFNFIFPLFGMPFVTASLPHSPQVLPSPAAPRCTPPPPNLRRSLLTRCRASIATVRSRRCTRTGSPR